MIALETGSTALERLVEDEQRAASGSGAGQHDLPRAFRPSSRTLDGRARRSRSNARREVSGASRSTTAGGSRARHAVVVQELAAGQPVEGAQPIEQHPHEAWRRGIGLAASTPMWIGAAIRVPAGRRSSTGSWSSGPVRRPRGRGTCLAGTVRSVPSDRRASPKIFVMPRAERAGTDAAASFGRILDDRERALAPRRPPARLTTRRLDDDLRLSDSRVRETLASTSGSTTLDLDPRRPRPRRDDGPGSAGSGGGFGGR